MKKPVLLTAHAADDLRSISNYTLQTWGEQQRKSYLSDLQTCMTALALMPGLGRTRSELKAGWRTIPCGSHVILYKEHEDRIEILRVFHGKQDIPPEDNA